MRQARSGYSVHVRCRERVVRGRLILALLLWVATAAPPVRAGGFTITSMGGRRSGSLVTLGHPDDLTASFHNPAGLADQPGIRLHLSNSFTLIQSRFRMQALNGRMYPELNPYGCSDDCPWPVDAQGYYRRTLKPESYFGTVPFFAASTDWSFAGRAGARVVSSLSVYLPVFYGATMPAEAPTAYQLMKGYFAVGAVTLATGWKISRYLSVGASLSYYYYRLSMRRRFSVVRMLTPLGQEDDPPAQAEAGQDLIGDLILDYTGEDHGVGWGLGMLIRPTSWLSIGLMYNQATAAVFRGGMSITSREPATLQAALEVLGYKLPRKLRVEMAVPPSVGAGISITPVPWMEVGIDARFWLYNLYREQKVTPLYDPDAEGTEVIGEADLSADKHYRLSYEVALGFVFRPLRRHPGLELLLGASYDRSPIPDETFSLDNVTLNSWNVAAGVRWAVNRHWRVAVTYAAYLYVPRHIRNSIVSPPSNGDASGVFHMPSLEAQYTF